MAIKTNSRTRITPHVIRNEADAWRYVAERIDNGQWGKEGICALLDELESYGGDTLLEIPYSVGYSTDYISVKNANAFLNAVDPEGIIPIISVYMINSNSVYTMRTRLVWLRTHTSVGNTTFVFKKGNAPLRVLFCLFAAEHAEQFPDVNELYDTEKLY